MVTESYDVFTKQNKQNVAAVWNANIKAPRGTEIFPFSPTLQLHLHLLVRLFWIFYFYDSDKLVAFHGNFPHVKNVGDQVTLTQIGI
jgi:hypothetical protein